jgi:aspartate 1-decarboxylase
MRLMFKSKIHRATVTQADVEYEGSITIDAELLSAADIVEHEWVHVWNVTNGARVETYALRGAPGSGVVCVNGAAAHHFRPGDLVIVATQTSLDEAAAARHVPTVVLVDAANRIKVARYTELPGPNRREPQVDSPSS